MDENNNKIIEQKRLYTIKEASLIACGSDDRPPLVEGWQDQRYPDIGQQAKDYQRRDGSAARD